MKKLRIAQFILICFLLCGCSSSTVNTMNEVEETPDPFYELATMQESKFGFDGVFAYELMEKMANEEFFFYLYDSTTPDTLMEELLNWGFTEENIDVLAKGYIIDFSTLTDVEKERIREVFPHNTLYALQNGTIVSTFKDYPLIPKEDSLDYDMEYKMAIENWIYGTMVGVNNHGFETITYEELLEKIANEEIFMLYAGRNSCKFCQVFTPILQNIVETYDFYSPEDETTIVPLYYLDTQCYYNDIVYEKEGAKETWENVKETLDLDFVPGFLLFITYWEIDLDPTQHIYSSKQFESHITSPYFTSDITQKSEMINACMEELYKILDDKLVIVEKTDCMVQLDMEDNRDYLFDYDTSYMEECFTPKDQWIKRVNDKEYIDVANDIYLENLQDNVLKYSVSLERVLTNDYQNLKFSFGGNAGTGFIIDIDKDCLYIATNKHVIDKDINSNKGYFTRFSCFRNDYDYIGKLNPINRYLATQTFRVDMLEGVSYIVGYSEEYDFAILRFDFAQNEFFNRIRFNELFEFSTPPRFDNVNPQIGDKVYRWDVRDIYDKEATIKEFTIKGIGLSNDFGSNTIQLMGRSGSGTSGSPFFNEKGELVGMHMGGQGEYSYILPSSIILEEYEKIMGHPLYQD